MAKNDFLRKLYDGGRWFLVSRAMFGAFTLEQTVVLSYLCNVDSMDATTKEESPNDDRKNGWFPCSDKKIEQVLNVSPRTHKRVLNELEALQILRRKRVGNPARRFLWINYERMESLINAQKSIVSKCETAPTRKTRGKHKILA